MRSRVSIITRDIRRADGEAGREFDVVSAATLMSAFIGGLFLVFFLAAFLPWLLSRGMTAAVEGMMNQIGFGSFHANTIWSWLLVLVMFGLFTVFIVMIATAILLLYNLLSQRTGMGMGAGRPPLELVAGEPVDTVIGAEDLDDASFDELYAEAQRRKIPGRSAMTKDTLRSALRDTRRRTSGRAKT
jgi:hypothetical protein